MGEGLKKARRQVSRTETPEDLQMRCLW